jgi:hypothetical protein
MGYLPSGKKYEDFSGWSHYNGLPAQRKNTRIFQRKKYEDFSDWSHCKGLPAQRKKYEDFSDWSHCNGFPARWKNTRIFQIGHIVMGYQPGGKIRGFFRLVTL